MFFVSVSIENKAHMCFTVFYHLMCLCVYVYLQEG